MAGIYIHIPFCSSRCTYCSFYSTKQHGKKEQFIATLNKEIEAKRDFFEGVRPDTIYIGGGTPSLISIAQYESLFAALSENFFGGGGFEGVTEFTIEANPDDITLEYAEGLRRLGVNRISMGIQTFDSAALKAMNRRHSSADAVEAYMALRKAGFENISLDLIFGYSIKEDSSVEDSWQRWRNDLATMISLKPEHISAYQLSIAPDKQLELLEDDVCAAQYSYLQKSLREGAYRQYEISNFCLSEREAIHNGSYWKRKAYLGLGPSAHSFRADRRSWNVANLKKYLEGSYDGGFELLTEENVADEIIMVGLRTVEGVSLKELSEHCDIEQLDIESLIRRGLLIKKEDTLSIPLDKFFIADSIIGELFH